MNDKPFVVRIGEIAEDDLVEVSAWYTERHAAGHDRFFDDFATARRALSIFPRAGRERAEIREGIRSTVVHPYVVFYRVDAAQRLVTVLRVIHGSRDFGPDDFEPD